jgi:hypothetical protein
MKQFKLKKTIFITLLSLLSLPDVLNAAPPTPTQKFNNQIILEEPDLYLLYWNYNDTDITFEIHVKNAIGWVAFGLSPNGGMFGSDIILTWLNPNGKFHFTDRFINQDSMPKIPIDKKQNWINLHSENRNGYLISKFTRKLKTCDGDDIEILPGTPRVIYAWGSQFINEDVTYHGPMNRGSRSLPLISSINQNIKLNMSDVETTEFRVNVSY